MNEEAKDLLISFLIKEREEERLAVLRFLEKIGAEVDAEYGGNLPRIGDAGSLVYYELDWDDWYPIYNIGKKAKKVD